jgi:hypothetical protein
MTATLRMITRRANGRESTRTTELPKNLLTIGRATDCDIHLPDLRIGLRHAHLTISDGVFYLEADGDNEFKANGRVTRKFEGRIGAPINAQFGPYTLKFSEEGGRLVIDVERVQAAATTHEDPEKVFSLRGTWLSKRSASWIGALLVAALFLVFPVTTFALKTDAIPKPARMQAGQMWISGELSGPHEMLGKDCGACHEAAFVSVRDEACVACHEDITHHADPVRMDQSIGTRTVVQQGLRTVAATFNKPAGRCAECHIEHNGHEGVAPASATSCTSCHDGMSARLPDASVQDASDFGRDHPELRPTLVSIADLSKPKFTREWTVPELERARKAREIAAPQSAGAATCDGFAIGQPNFRGLPQPAKGSLPGEALAGDDSGLVFPHDVHLEEKGCVSAIAQRLGAKGGYGDKLVCKDCHTADEDGIGFKTVSMEENCSACHSLVFENVGGFERELRHGRTNDVIATLLDFYQARVVGAALGGATGENRRRPGAAADRAVGLREVAFAQASGRAATRVRAIFAEGGACYGCHVINPPTTPSGLDFVVQPVTLRDTFLPKGSFNHRAHEIAEKECEDCHEARTSRTSADVLLPPVANCQECHGGEHAMAQVQSTCVMCHGFHSEEVDARPLRPAAAQKEARWTPPSWGLFR